MTSKDERSKAAFEPNPEVMKLWPDVSGNAINGSGEAGKGRPRPVFWRTDGSTPHAPVMHYFFERDKDVPAIIEARKYRARTLDIPLSDVAPVAAEKAADAWTALIKDAAIEGAGDAFMDDIVNRLDDLELFSDEQEDLAAVILQNSFQLPFDPEGRVVLPQTVIEHAGLSDEAVFAGRGSRFQIWQPDAYEENNRQTFERVRSRGATLPPPRRDQGGGRE